MLAFFVISTHLGGAERSLLDLVIQLKKQNKDFLVVTPKHQGPLLDELKRQSIHYEVFELPSWLLSFSRKRPLELAYKLPLASLLMPIILLRLHWFIKKRKLQTIHSTGLKFHLLLGFYLKWKPRVKLIIHLRDIVYSSPLKSIFFNLAKCNNIIWIANSKVTAESVAPIKTQLIYNGFLAPERSKLQPSLKYRLGIDEDHLLIGLVGAIARWKGQREFIEMANILLKQHPRLQFIVVGSEIYDTTGDKGELAHLKQQAAKIQSPQQLHFLDFQKNISSIYAGLDFLVHASILAEPFGRVIVEAMSYGLPVSASKIGGPLEIIEDKKSGLLHRPGDPGSMAENISFLLNNPRECREISENAQQRSKDFSMENHVRQMTAALGLN